MNAKHITPILNVSNIPQSFLWFETLGWSQEWSWGTPPSFGAVSSGQCEIFLCENAQGGKGKSTNLKTFGPGSNEAEEKAVWMSIWVENVDTVHAHCLKHKIEITWPPTDMSWNVREMHMRHPDGHVFRISQANEAG